MKAIMPRIKKEWVNEIIVVGDGSTYGTLGYAKTKAMLLLRLKEKGIRQGTIEGIPVVKIDYVISFSPSVMRRYNC